MKKIIALFFCITSVTIYAQTNQNVWNGKKCAVVLTYDDGYNQQLDNAIPVLDSLNLKATFYISAFQPDVKNRLNDWRLVAKKGYELGNHTLFHPCIKKDGSDWPTKENDMRTYTVQRMENEIRMTNVFLQALDGNTKRTFAFTCGDMKVQDSFFINGMKKDFVAARAVRNVMHKINEIDLYNVDCYMVNNDSFYDLKQWADKAIQTNSLLVILFHGVGGGNGLDISVDNHRKFLSYLKQNEKDIYIASMLDVAEYIKAYKL